VPLRERPSDVSLMTDHFLTTLASEMGLAPRKISEEAMNLLKNYSFPGNVRELRNIVERALIESAGKNIAPEHIYLMPESEPQPSPVSSDAPLPLNVKAAEGELIRRALEETDGNVTEAAKRLGMHRSRLYRRLRD
jgi:DNA-binding NtrC family response regulator